MYKDNWKELFELRREFKDKLKEKYPEFFGPSWERFGDYLDIGPGWFKVVEDLSSRLKEEITTNFPNTTLTYLQIKEKFGTLRIYVDILGDGYEKFNAIIRAAEHESSKTCQECGQPGSIRPTGWVQTLCNQHYIEAMK